MSKLNSSPTAFSIYLSYLLRHDPDSIGLKMDTQGYVDVAELIRKVNTQTKYTIDRFDLESIVATDDKGRYRFNDNHMRIRACQGHSIPWVIPISTEKKPPDRLYHGTTSEALIKIMESEKIDKMRRHAVHMHVNAKDAEKSAKRWHKVPVVIVIDAARMYALGHVFSVTDNNVWLTDNVPVEFILFTYDPE